MLGHGWTFDERPRQRSVDDVQLIGFLGGMSWESTAEYYRLANELVRDRCGGLHSARCVTYSVDFAAIERMQADGNWEEAASALARAGQALSAAGADFLVLCTNTMHKVADAVTEAVDIPLLHIGDTTAAAVTSAGIRRVGLLGTGFTMSQPFYTDRLARNGLDVIVPSEQDQAIVHRIIYDELCVGVISDESREEYRQGHQQPCDAGGRGRDLWLHRDRAARRPAGQSRACLPHHPAARRSCCRPGLGRVAGQTSRAALASRRRVPLGTASRSGSPILVSTAARSGTRAPKAVNSSGSSAGPQDLK